MLRLVIVLTVLLVPASAEAATLSGGVWSDTDGDGVRDRTEKRLRGVKVAVLKGKKVVAKRTTTGTGWKVAKLKKGRYQVRVTAPRGTRRSSRGTLTRRLRKRTSKARVDVGFAPIKTTTPEPQPTPTPAPATTPAPTAAPTATPAPPPPSTLVGGTVFSDDDGDGIRDVGDDGVAGVTIEVWDADRTARLDGTVTDANGDWTLPAAASTPVRVRLVLPPNGIYSPANVGPDATNSDIDAAGANAAFSQPVTGAIVATDVDAGVRFPGKYLIGDRLWRDVDLDGVQDASETLGFGGYTVEAYNDNFTQLIGSDGSSGAGDYGIPVPAGGTYRLRFPRPGGWTFTRQSFGSDDTLDSDPFNRWTSAQYGDTSAFVASGSRTDLDAGYVTLATIGNFVWRDDGDGIQETGEPGVPGVVVQLWNSAETALYDQTTTDADGKYTLRTIGPASYRVRVLRPTGATFAPKGAGSDDQKDSDVNPTGDDAGFTDAIVISGAVISTVVWDAGLVI